MGTKRKGVLSRQLGSNFLGCGLPERALPTGPQPQVSCLYLRYFMKEELSKNRSWLAMSGRSLEKTDFSFCKYKGVKCKLFQTQGTNPVKMVISWSWWTRALILPHLPCHQPSWTRHFTFIISNEGIGLLDNLCFSSNFRSEWQLCLVS